MKAKITKTYNILIRILIIVGTYGFLYKKLFVGRDLQHQYNLFISLLEKPGTKSLLAVVIILMLANWGLEAQKWRYMIGKIESISFFKSFQAVFTGSSVSFFTPNRTGEYFGRVFFLDRASHVQGILITILGSMSQLLITIITGTLSMLIFIPQFISGNSIFSGYIYFGFVFLIIAIDALLLFLLLNAQFLAVLREKLFRARLKKFRRHLAIFSDFRGRDMAYVILLSFLRYMIFTGQFVILLKLFSVPIPVFDAVIITSLVFFVLSIVPTVTLTELGIRDSASVYFFGLYFTQAGMMNDSIMIGVVSAATLLWVINLAVPAVIGTVFVFRLKFFRKNSDHA
ncbi:MAG: lysylphosphatidylglycerol synthase domain-containing protein [Bacteroidetes bacterium]|nr:lysylphosphatidylglycerol synthase domain-containing protein [Bacteroidota bacterium]